jgi:glycosyltransferase involved in cell wall biosynthesis
MALKVLQMGQYPIQRRISGGQRRAGAIFDAYRRNGVDARFAAIFDPAAYPNEVRADGSFVVGPITAKAVARNPLLIDVTTGARFADDPVCAEPLLRFWNRFQPDVVQIEHCYLWPGVKRLFETGRARRAPVIYSSHNHETAMKRAIYERSLPAEVSAVAAADVGRTEESLTRHAELVVTVSDADASVARAMGAKSCAIVRNGSDRVELKSADLQRWSERLFSDGTRSFALFVSSNHLPNYLGLERLAGTFLGYLPPDCRIAVAGGIGKHMEEQPSFRSDMLLNRSRLRLLGSALSDGDLAAVVQLANAILLPIADGGGSNIKTVEALLSGRPVIATAFAFRSYEEFQSLPRVCLRENPADFQSAIQKAVRAPHQPSVESETHLAAITWPCLGDEFVRLVLDRFQKG